MVTYELSSIYNVIVTLVHIICKIFYRYFFVTSFINY